MADILQAVAQPPGQTAQNAKWGAGGGLGRLAQKFFADSPSHITRFGKSSKRWPPPPNIVVVDDLNLHVHYPQGNTQSIGSEGPTFALRDISGAEIVNTYGALVNMQLEFVDGSAVTVQIPKAFAAQIIERL